MDQPGRKLYQCEACAEVFLDPQYLECHQRQLPRPLEGPTGAPRPALELELGSRLKKLVDLGGGVVLRNCLIELRGSLRARTGLTFPAVRLCIDEGPPSNQWSLSFRRRRLIRGRLDDLQVERLQRQELCVSYYGAGLICAQLGEQLPQFFWRFLNRSELRDSLAELEVSDPELVEQSLSLLDQELLLRLLRLLVQERFSLNRLPALLEVLLEEHRLGRPLSPDRLVTPAVIEVMLES